MDYSFQNRNNILTEPTISDGSLILAFHGGGGEPVYFQAGIDLESTFPDSYICYLDADDTISNLWRSGNSNIDTAYVLAVIEDLKVKYPAIDPLNIHLIGMSNGGRMCYKVAAVLDELEFRSITTISATYMCPELFDCTADVLHIYGSKDTIVPPEGNENIPSITEVEQILEGAGGDIKFMKVIGAGHSLDSIKSGYKCMMLDIRNHTGL